MGVDVSHPLLFCFHKTEIMKHQSLPGFNFLFLFLFFFYKANAQAVNNNYLQTSNGPFLQLDNITFKVNEYLEENRKYIASGTKPEGSFFLSDNWNKGYIKLYDGRVAGDLQIRFNAYSQKIHFFKDSTELVLSIAVPEFGYTLTTTEAGLKAMIFRNGYPAVDQQDTSSYYEVLVDGKISLLRFHHKSVREIIQINGLVTYSIEDRGGMYLYKRDENRIFLFKKKKEYLAGFFSGDNFSNFEKIYNSSASALKTESGCIEFVRQLNRSFSGQ